MVGDDFHPAAAHRKRLDTFFIPFFAVVRQPIAAHTWTALMCRNIAAWRARAVVVVYPLVGGFRNFIDRKKC